MFGLWAVAIPAVCAAQPAAGTVYVEGGAIVARQSGAQGQQSVTYVTAPGGTTVGWAAGGGAYLVRGWSIHAELASTGTMTAREPSRYDMIFNEERRDRFLTVGLRFALPLTPSIALEPFAGVVLTFPQAFSQVEYAPASGLPVRPPDPRVTHRLDTAIGPAFGIDARIGAGRAAVVPSFRVLRSGTRNGRYDDTPTSPTVEIESIYPGGYPDWTVRMGAAVRLRF
jgi:hypothetical protein